MHQFFSPFLPCRRLSPFADPTALEQICLSCVCMMWKNNSIYNAGSCQTYQKHRTCVDLRQCENFPKRAKKCEPTSKTHKFIIHSNFIIRRWSRLQAFSWLFCMSQLLDAFNCLFSSFLFIYWATRCT